MSPKERVAEAAVGFLRSGMTIGLGSGSTAECFLTALAKSLSRGQLRAIRGVPTSRRSEQIAAELSIPLTTLAECPQLDLTIDGADEIDPQLNLIKGLGGALLREKIVAQASRSLLIIGEQSKVVPILGTRCPLPVEVVPFAHEAHERFFRSLGATPVLRRGAGGVTVISDNGNYIYDCRFERIEQPADLEQALLRRAGVVDCGLFLNMATMALIADEQKVTELRAPATTGRP